MLDAANTLQRFQFTSNLDLDTHRRLGTVANTTQLQSCIALDLHTAKQQHG